MGISRESIRPLVTESAFILLLIIVGILLRLSWILYAATGCLILVGFTVFFFRDPERIPPDGDHLILSPADGLVVGIDRRVPAEFNDQTFQVISIFLSLWNVHINRIPVSGRIIYFDRRAGRFLPAFQATASEKNAYTLIGIETRRDLFLVKQVAGFLARGIVCRLEIGDRVKRGDRFGMIKLGSRVDLYLPESVKLLIRRGRKVRGGISILGVTRNDE